MKSVLIWILAAANAVLLAGVVGRFTHGDVAKAQMAPQRRVSDYVLAPMEQANGQTGIVCVIDENSGMMAAVSYNGRGLVTMPPLNLERPIAPRALNGNPNNYNGRRY